MNKEVAHSIYGLTKLLVALISTRISCRYVRGTVTAAHISVSTINVYIYMLYMMIPATYKVLYELY